MNFYFRIFGLLAIIIGLAAPAHADVEDGATLDPAMVRTLMAWVAQRTGTSVPVLPEVVASRTRFHEVLEHMSGGFAGRPKSAYLNGVVYLDNRSWDPEDPTQISLLVHELVHHAQHYMKTRWACHDAKETQAYNLQNEWLEENGHSPFVTASWIQRVSSCPGGNGLISLAQGE